MTDDTPTAAALTDDERSKAIVAAYQAGRKIIDIERDFGVPRSTIYRLVQAAGLNQRQRPNYRQRGGERDLAMLYSVIETQNARIKELEALLVP